MLAISVAACTATSSSVSPQLKAEGGSLVEALASAAQQSQSTAPETSAAPEGGAVLALAATTAAAPSGQTASQPAASTAEASASATVPLPTPSPASATWTNATAPEAAQFPKKAGIELADYTSAPRQMAFATPSNPEDGRVMRLFVDNPSRKDERAKRLEPKKDTRDYHYTLPGVREDLGFEIKRRSKGLYDDSDIDVNEEDGSSAVRLASAPGFGRLLPRGLEKQRESVDTACLKPRLVTMLKTIERHFRRQVMITSGYRSPSYNRLVNGARRSLHMLCEAADIQVDGISKWEIARFVRALPDRGGVGTYCNTDSVHVDIGPERDWNWRCVARR